MAAAAALSTHSQWGAGGGGHLARASGLVVARRAAPITPLAATCSSRRAGAGVNVALVRNHPPPHRPRLHTHAHTHTHARARCGPQRRDCAIIRPHSAASRRGRDCGVVARAAARTL